MIRKIIISSLAAVVVLAAASPAYAMGDRFIEKTTGRVEKQAEANVAVTEDSSASSTNQAAESGQTQRDKIEARKAELLDKFAQKTAERKQKLDGRRLAQCENRQQKINELIDRSVANGRTQLANIDRVKDQVAAFYAKKSLSSTDYDAALANVEQAKVEASAALDAMSAQNFDCQMVDGAKPSDAITTAQQSRKTAFSAYRQSVVELIKVTKQAFVASQQGAQDVQN